MPERDFSLLLMGLVWNQQFCHEAHNHWQRESGSEEQELHQEVGRLQDVPVETAPGEPEGLRFRSPLVSMPRQQCKENVVGEQSACVSLIPLSVPLSQCSRFSLAVHG